MKSRIFHTFVFFIVFLWFFSNTFAVTTQTINLKNNISLIEARWKMTNLKQILYSAAMAFDYTKLVVVIDGLQREPRGRMKDAQIFLSPYVARDTEFTKLFVHELAHYIDIYSLVWSASKEDISNNFYYISWQAPTTKRYNQWTIDFVSGYAATNQYEDFAESFVFYVFHNAVFADRALKSESIRQKYLFFANSIFPAWSFQGTDFTIGKIPSYVWDTTKISFSLQKYLYSL